MTAPRLEEGSDKGLEEVGRLGFADRATDAPHGDAEASPSSGSVSTGAGFLLKTWAVSVDGFPTHTYFAASRGAGLARAWECYTSAYNEATFGEFLKIARARRAADPHRFGEPITVGGAPAFYVGESMQYVVFARPGELRTFLSHPADVSLCDSNSDRQAETSPKPEGREASSKAREGEGR